MSGFIGLISAGEAQHQTFDATRAPKFPGLSSYHHYAAFSIVFSVFIVSIIVLIFVFRLGKPEQTRHSISDRINSHRTILMKLLLPCPTLYAVSEEKFFSLPTVSKSAFVQL